jgi:FAD/FMN-containing dehydrogenase
MPLIRNFGRNVRFTPKRSYEPRTDEDVLRILRDHRGGRIRCIGALHSWSRIVEAHDVIVDLRHFDSVAVVTKGMDPGHEGAQVRLGGGCTIQRALEVLAAEGLTLPTIGAITAQTVAGAISTGTHGSGSQSLSHFVEEVRLAGYDPDSGEPAILRLRGRDELLAARCALGGLGVILDVVLRARGVYRIEEEFAKVESAEAAMAGRKDWPLQQFFLMPWKWRYYVYRRKPTDEPPRRGSALWRRLVLFIFIDVAQHALLKGLVLPLAWALGDWVCRLFLRATPIGGYRRIDDSRHVLTLRHDLFRHVEMEVFVPEGRLPEAMNSVRALIEFAAGQRAAFPDEDKQLEATYPVLRRTWTHHYPVSFRYVLPEETLISMASKRFEKDHEAWVAISFFSYRRPDNAAFARFAAVVAAHLVGKYGARLHWGKFFPRDFSGAAGAYGDNFRRFEAVRSRYDRAGVFWIENL